MDNIYHVCNDYSLELADPSDKNVQSDMKRGYKWVEGRVAGHVVEFGREIKTDELHYLRADTKLLNGLNI